MANSIQFRWDSEVRHYELDSQGILNNAIYLNYFDHARVKWLHGLGIDWRQMHLDGLDLVVAECQLKFKAPLKIHDKFYISSTLTRPTRLKLQFNQELKLVVTDKLVCQAETVVVCVDRDKGRPVVAAHLIQELGL